jgi:hypothetical protein
MIAPYNQQYQPPLPKHSIQALMQLSNGSMNTSISDIAKRNCMCKRLLLPAALGGEPV